MNSSAATISTTIPSTVEPRPITPEVVKPLKLSEAMRLGAISTDQAFHTLRDPDGRTCAIGAAMVGFGDTTSNSTRGLVPLLYTKISLPNCDVQHNQKVCSQPFSSIGQMIIHQNDYHMLPRNQIADNLEKLGL